MGDVQALRAKYCQQLEKALSHLEYSYAKVQSLPTNPSQLGEEALETWESFAARFSRVADIFLTKYLRACLLHQDPALSGSLRDHLNQAEKLALIDSVDIWLSIRQQRNLIEHEYSEETMQAFLQGLLRLTPVLLGLRATLSVHHET